MTNYDILKFFHITGALMILAGLAALWGMSYAGTPIKKNVRIPLALIHGLGMLLSLGGGWMMLAKFTADGPIPGWAWAKLALWLVLGGSMVLAKRKAHVGLGILGLFIGLSVTAILLAVFKPF